MIKPTVGRKVWYRPSEYDRTGIGAMNTVHGQPLDATIVAVWGDRMVNALVYDIMGKSFIKTSVTLMQGDTEDRIPRDKDGKDVGGYVEWMPYQIGQAKKHEGESKA